MKLIKYYFPIENDYKVDLYPTQISREALISVILPLTTSLLLIQVTKNRVRNELFVLTDESPQINLNKE